MADMYDAPPGPPPPKAPVVPAGWLAKWNEQYKEWFYVNTITKKSQWEKPTLPARPPNDIDDDPSGPPPSYTPGNRAPSSAAATDTKRNPYDDNDDVESEDAKLARRLQDEEDAKARGFGAPGSSGSGSASASSFPNQLPPRPDDRDVGGKPRGLLGKIFGGSSSSRRQDAYAAPMPMPMPVPAPAVGRVPSPGYRGPGSPYGPPQQQPYGQPAYGGPQYGGYGPPPPAGGGGYGGYPPPQQGGYYQEPPQGYYGGGGGGGGGYAQDSRPARTGGGLGTAGGAALGLGAGLVGGMLLEDVIQDHDQSMYQQGFDNGEMADGGGDFGGGGGDFGGGDF